MRRRVFAKGIGAAAAGWLLAAREWRDIATLAMRALNEKNQDNRTIMRGVIIVGALIGTAGLSHLLAADAGGASPSGVRLVARVESITIQSSPEAGGKCIDVRNQQFVQGAPLQTWPCNQTPAQIFSYELAEGRLTIGGLCVDAWGGKGQPGDSLRLYPCHGGTNQTWSIKQSGHYLKFVGINGLCMDIHEGDIVLGACGEVASQNWVVRSAKVP